MIKTMKPRILQFNIILAILLLVSQHSGLKAQTFTSNKTASQTFLVDKETTVEINNKYGKIHVISWEKDSVMITANLTIASSNLGRLEKMKNSINFNFANTRYYVSAITDFGTSSNQILTELKSLSDAIVTGQNQIEINYMVYCPAEINLNLVNKFGGIFIDDMVGDLRISLSNGDLKINSVEGKAQIELAFGSGIINDLREGQLNVSYSDLNIKDALKLDINSKSSTLNIGIADYIKTTSRRDKYFVNTTHSFYGNSEFSQIWIDKLICETDFAMKYGSFTLSETPREFCNINLNSEYTDINLTLVKGSAYEADVFYPVGATANFPADRDKYGFRNEQEGSLQYHAAYKTGTGDALPRLRIYASQKSYISILEK